MTLKRFFAMSVLLILLLGIYGCSRAPDPAGGRAFMPLESVTVTGELQDRISLSARRMSGNQPFWVELIVEDVVRDTGFQRRFEEWEGDISGRWLWAMSLIGRLNGSVPAKMDDIVFTVLDCQNENGSFGIDREAEGWEEWGQQLWGHNRLLLGLTEYCRLTADGNVLNAAEKLADYLAASVARWDSRMVGHKWWNNYTSCLESLTAFQRLVPKKAYLDASLRIVALLPEFGNYHSHSFLSGLIGQVDLYLLTGDPSLLTRVERLYWQKLKPALLPGADIPEWYPVSARNEGCSVSDWVRLNFHLWLATGRAAYLEAAESTILNSLSYCQTPNGFFSHSPLTPWGFTDRTTESWWCCTQHGAGCLAEWASAIYAYDNSSLWINFPVPSSAVIPMDGATVNLSQQTSYPGDGRVGIELKIDKPAEFTLRVRVPSWADSVDVTIAGARRRVRVDDGYLDISRSWSGTTTIEIDLPLNLRLVRADGRDLGETIETQSGGIFASKDNKSRDIGWAGIMYGPVWLAAVDNLAPSERLILKLSEARRPVLERASEHPAPYSWSVPGFVAEIASPNTKKSRRMELKPIPSWTGEWPYREEMVNFYVNGEKARRRNSVRFLFPVAVTRAE
jgi:hypothetical protein